MRRFRHDPVRCRCHGRFGMHNEVRSVVITRLGQMNLVANPGLVPLDAQVSVRVVGGGKKPKKEGGYYHCDASGNVLLPRKTAGPTRGATFPPQAVPATRREPWAHTRPSVGGGHRFQSSAPTPRVRFGPWESDTHQSDGCSAQTTAA